MGVSLGVCTLLVVEQHHTVGQEYITKPNGVVAFGLTWGGGGIGLGFTEIRNLL